MTTWAGCEEDGGGAGTLSRWRVAWALGLGPRSLSGSPGWRGGCASQGPLAGRT